MRKVLLLFFAMTFMMTSVAFAEVKIGVVDMQVVAAESTPALAAKEEMDAKFGAQRAELEAEALVLQEKAIELQNNPTEEKQVEFITLKREFDEAQYAFATAVEEDEILIRQRMVTLVFQAAYNISQAKGFNFVVDITAGGILYAEQEMDMTADIVAEVNRLWEESLAAESGE